MAEASKSFYYEKPQEETKKYGFQRAADLDALLKRKQKIASQEVSSEVNEDAIRQVQKSTVIPPKQRTEADIKKEVAEASNSFYYEKPQEETKKKYGFQRAADLDALLKRKRKIADQEVSSEVNEDAIRQVQKSTVIPPKQRTEEDIEREVAEASKSFYYEKPQEETKKYEFQRAADLDALLKRKQKIASVEVKGGEVERPAVVPAAIPSAPPRRSHTSRQPEPKPAAVPASQPRRVPRPAPQPATSQPAEEEDYLAKLLKTRRASTTPVRFLRPLHCRETTSVQSRLWSLRPSHRFPVSHLLDPDPDLSLEGKLSSPNQSHSLSHSLSLSQSHSLNLNLSLNHNPNLSLNPSHNLNHNLNHNPNPSLSHSLSHSQNHSQNLNLNPNHNLLFFEQFVRCSITQPLERAI